MILIISFSNDFYDHDDNQCIAPVHDHQCIAPVHDECRHCNRILGQGLEGPPCPGCSGSRLCQNTIFAISAISKMQ